MDRRYSACNVNIAAFLIEWRAIATPIAGVEIYAILALKCLRSLNRFCV